MRVNPPRAVPTTDTGPGCEPIAEGLLGEPVAAVSSLAFVVAGVVIVLLHRRSVTARPDREPAPSVLGYATLVAAVGLGSLVQHGPDPAWSDLAHDLPLLATVAFMGADSLADLLGRARVWWWWVAPTLALVPLILLAPRPGDLAQVGVAVVAVALTLARARRPHARRRVVCAVGLLALGGLLGTLSRAGGPLCVPESLWQGHAAWHVLASVALVVLAPLVGRRVDRPAVAVG